jgi:hypothetical protein
MRFMTPDAKYGLSDDVRFDLGSLTFQDILSAGFPAPAGLSPVLRSLGEGGSEGVTYWDDSSILPSPGQASRGAVSTTNHAMKTSSKQTVEIVAGLDRSDRKVDLHINQPNHPLVPLGRRLLPGPASQGQTPSHRRPRPGLQMAARHLALLDRSHPL